MGERWNRHVVGIVFAALAAVAVLWPSLAGAATGGGGTGASTSTAGDGPAIASFAVHVALLAAAIGATAMTLLIIRSGARR